MRYWFLPTGIYHGDPDGTGFVSITGVSLPEIPPHSTLVDIRRLLKQAYPEESPEWIALESQRIWVVYHDISPEDVVLIKYGDTSFLTALEVKEAHSTSSQYGQAYKVTALRDIPAGKALAHLHALPTKAYAIALEKADAIHHVELHTGRRKTFHRHRVYAWCFAALLLLKLLVILHSYWSDATGHFTP